MDVHALAHFAPSIIGTFAALCSMGSFAPQVIKLWREKDASAVSLQMYAVTVTAFVLWVAYGILLKSWPLIMSNSVCVAMSAAILILKLKFDAEAKS